MFAVKDHRSQTQHPKRDERTDHYRDQHKSDIDHQFSG